MTRPWTWGLAFGLVVGGSVVVVSSLKYGFSGPLLVIGIVIAAAFGGLIVIGYTTERRRPTD